MFFAGFPSPTAGGFALPLSATLRHYPGVRLHSGEPAPTRRDGKTMGRAPRLSEGPLAGRKVSFPPCIKRALSAPAIWLMAAAHGGIRGHRAVKQRGRRRSAKPAIVLRGRDHISTIEPHSFSPASDIPPLADFFLAVASAFVKENTKYSWRAPQCCGSAACIIYTRFSPHRWPTCVSEISSCRLI